MARRRQEVRGDAGTRRRDFIALFSACFLARRTAACTLGLLLFCFVTLSLDFARAPSVEQRWEIEQKQNYSDRARACGRNGENLGDACIRSLRASRPFLGPLPAFAPRQAAPSGVGPQIQGKKQNSDRPCACGRNGENLGDACIRSLRASRPFLCPLPAFAPLRAAPSGAPGPANPGKKTKFRSTLRMR
jgi:hypothetical protein